MKSGFAISALGHAAIIGWAVVSIAAPKPLTVPDVEAMPIDIVDISELTQSIEGDREAEVVDTPAPTPTPTVAPERPEPAENTGETDTDVKADAPTPTPAPPVEKVETAAAPEPTPEPPTPDVRPEPAPEPAPEPEPTPEPKPEPVAAPTPEPEPAPETPKTDIAALAEQAEQKTEQDSEEVKLPEKVARPKPRPARPKPAEKKAPAKETKTALLDKATPSAGGKKRSEKPASKGVEKANNDVKLSASEIDALRAQIQGCWNVGALVGSSDADKLRAKVVFRLDRSGAIDGRPTATATGGDNTTNRTFAGGARRAVQRCAPYKLPSEKYDTWADVTVNFSLADML